MGPLVCSAARINPMGARNDTFSAIPLIFNLLPTRLFI